MSEESSKHGHDRRVHIGPQLRAEDRYKLDGVGEKDGVGRAPPRARRLQLRQDGRAVEVHEVDQLVRLRRTGCPCTRGGAKTA